MRQRARAEIVVLMSSLKEIERLGIPVVFADRNARLSRAVKWAPEEPRHADLYGGLPWQVWQDRDFRHDPNDPERKERYQAEALVHRGLPVEGLKAIITSDKGTHTTVSSAVAAASLSLPVAIRSHWYP